MKGASRYESRERERIERPTRYTSLEREPFYREFVLREKTFVLPETGGKGRREGGLSVDDHEWTFPHDFSLLPAVASWTLRHVMLRSDKSYVFVGKMKETTVR